MLAAENMPKLSEKPTILFVDDEPRVLTSMRALFRRIYRVRIASGATEALEILESEHIDVLISDQRMPHITGVELLAQVRTEYPHTMRILLTGYSDLEAIEASINEGEVFRYLVKPCPPTDLKRVVELAVTAARAEFEVPTITDVVEVQDHATTQAERGTEPVPLRLADTSDLAPDSAQDSSTSEGSPKTAVNAQVTLVEVQDSVVSGAAADAANQPLDQDSIASDALQETTAVAQGALDELQNRPVDIVVLSKDEKLREAVTEAMAGEAVVHSVFFLDEAMELMTTDPIGVLVTDLAVNEHEVNLMTRELKQYAPELVTILASERSDANLLIDLINHGQVFRFLLKPIHSAQCRIWLRSATAKHKELLASPDALLRHVVDEKSEDSDIPLEAMTAESDLWSDNAPVNAMEMKERIRAQALAVAQRMGEGFSKEGRKAMQMLRESRAAQSVSEKYSELKRRISQWKANHG